MAIIRRTFQAKPGRKSMLAELLHGSLQTVLVQAQLHVADCGLLHEPCSSK